MPSTSVEITIGDDLDDPPGGGEVSDRTYNLNTLLAAEGYPVNQWMSIDEIVVRMKTTAEPSGGDEEMLFGVAIDGIPAAPAGTWDHDPNPPDGSFETTVYGVGASAGMSSPTGVLISDGSIEITFSPTDDVRTITTEVFTFAACLDIVAEVPGATKGTVEVEAIIVNGEWHHFPLLSRSRTLWGANWSLGGVEAQFPLLSRSRTLWGADYSLPAVEVEFPLLSRTRNLFGPVGVTGGAKSIEFPLLPRTPVVKGFMWIEE